MPYVKIYTLSVYTAMSTCFHFSGCFQAIRLSPHEILLVLTHSLTLFHLALFCRGIGRDCNKKEEIKFCVYTRLQQLYTYLHIHPNIHLCCTVFDTIILLIALNDKHLVDPQILVISTLTRKFLREVDLGI